jgi:hypothetical protein
LENTITFNIIKHHLIEIRQFIDNPPVNYLDVLKIIGSSLTDLYIGKLSVEEIKNEVLEQLTATQLIDKEFYNRWIEKAGGYRKLTLSDSSKWILRNSENNEKFVHLHPARISMNIIRLKASALKTAILFLILNHDKNYQNKLIDVKYINQIRIDLKLSPIKNSNENIHIAKAIKLLQQS